MKKYTVGFIFTADLKQVLLIHKNAPDWQKGKINGLGGKMEQGESSLNCFVRELAEESGINIEKKQLRRMGLLQGKEWKVYVFGGIYLGQVFEPVIYEKEKIEWFKVEKLPINCVPNLHWLIPFARNELLFNSGNQFILKEPKFDTDQL